MFSGRYNDTERYFKANEKSPEFYRFSGDRNYSHANFSLALNEYKKAEEIEPKNPDYKYRLGKTLLQLGNLTEAHIYFQKALELDPLRAEFHNALSYSLHTQGKFEEASEHCYKAIKLSPHTPTFRHNLGAIQMEILKEKMNFSIEELHNIAMEYERAGKIESDIPRIAKNFSTLGFLYFTIGEFEYAGIWFRRALELYPESAESHINIATLHLLERNYDRAIYEFNKAMELQRDLFSPYRGLALCHENLGNINMAILEYEELLKINPTDKYARKSLDEIYHSLRIKDMSHSFLNLSRIYFREGEFEKAAYELQNIINIGGETFELITELNRVGLCLLIKGKETEALRIYEKVAALLKKLYKELQIKYYRQNKNFQIEGLFPLSLADTERIICYRMLRNIYRKKNLYTTSDYWNNELFKAIQQISVNMKFYFSSQQERLINEIDESIKTSWYSCPEFYKVMGDINAYESNFKAAMSNYKKAIEFLPTETAYFIALANCLFKCRKYKEASIEYGKAILINSRELIRHRETLKKLFNILKKEELKIFIANCLQTIKSKPNEPACYFILGEMYLQQENPDMAIKLYKCALVLDFPRKLFLNSLANAYAMKGLSLHKESNLKEAELMLILAYTMSNEEETIQKSLFGLGNIYYQWNDPEKASEFFLKLIQLNSGLKLKAYKFLGIIFGIKGESEKASYYNRKFLEEINIKSRFYLILSEDGQLKNTKEQNATEDISDYERAIELEPEKTIYYIILTKLYKNINKLEELSSKFSQKISQNRNYASIFIQIGRIYYLENQIDKVNSEYDKAFKAGLRTEEFAYVLNEFGMCYYKQGQMNLANIKFNEAIMCFQDYPEPHYHIGNIYSQMGEHEKAIEYFNKAALKETTSKKKANFLNTLGNEYLKSGELKLAFEKFGEAIALEPTCEEAYYNLAIAEYRAGILDKATQNFLKVLELDPHHFRAIKWLRDLYKGNAEVEKQWKEQLTKLLKKKLSNQIFLGNISCSEELEELITEYERSVTLTQEDAKYFKKLGKLYIKERKLDKATIAFEKSTRLNPEFSYLHIELSKAYIEEKNFDEAGKEANKALECDIKSVDLSSVCIKIGNKFLQEGELDKARDEYERAFNMGCKNKELALKINKIGVEYSSINSIDEAIEHFKKAIHILPDNFIFYKNLATMYQRKGLIIEAIEFFEYARDIQPDDIKILEKLKSVYQEGGYFNKAINITEKLLKLTPQNSTYKFSIAKMYHELGKYEKALEYYTETINIKKEWHSPYLGIGYIYLEQNKSGEAQKNLEKALTLNPKSPKTLVGLARIYALQGEPVLSEEYYDMAINVYEEETQKKEVTAEIHIAYGDLFFYKMEIDKAIEEYKKSLKIREENALGLLRLGKALVIKGEILSGEIELKKIGITNMEFPEAYFYLGDICKMKGLLHEAIEYYRDVIRLNPDWVYKAYQRIGDTYSDLNEKTLSLKCHTKAKQLKEGCQIINLPLLCSMDIKKVIESMEKDLRET